KVREIERITLEEQSLVSDKSPSKSVKSSITPPELIINTSNEYQQEIEQLNIQVCQLYTKRQLEHALGLATKSIELARQSVGEQHPLFAQSLNNLAAIYHSLGSFTQAEPLYLQAIEINRIAIGEDHPDFAANLNGLALIYKS